MRETEAEGEGRRTEGKEERREGGSEGGGGTQTVPTILSLCCD